MSDIGEDDGDYCLDSFFLNEDYVVKDFPLQKDVIVQLKCSQMSSTDHDLTGQIVWPASVLLANFIVNQKDEFRNKNVIELGAGCGLGGFVAGYYSKEVILTDGNEIVVKLLHQNETFFNECVAEKKFIPAVENVEIKVCQLLWGFKNDISNLYGQLPLSVMDEDGGNGPDIIIGADVILWPLYTESLIKTIKHLLLFKPKKSVCYISYINRANTTTDLLFRKTEQYGLIVERIPVDSFLSDEDMPQSLRTLEKHLLKLTLDQDRIDLTQELYEEDVDKYFSASAPC